MEAKRSCTPPVCCLVGVFIGVFIGVFDGLLLLVLLRRLGVLLEKRSEDGFRVHVELKRGSGELNET